MLDDLDQMCTQIILIVYIPRRNWKRNRIMITCMSRYFPPNSVIQEHTAIRHSLSLLLILYTLLIIHNVISVLGAEVMTDTSSTQNPPSSTEEGVVYFERFWGLADTAVPISGTPIRFTVTCLYQVDSVHKQGQTCLIASHNIVLLAHTSITTMHCHANNYCHMTCCIL